MNADDAYTDVYTDVMMEYLEELITVRIFGAV